MNDLSLASQILLNKQIPFEKRKADALDYVTKSLYGRDPTISITANKIWEDLKNDSEFWTQVDSVFKYCTMKETHFLALKVLEEQIRSKWGIINVQSRETIKGFIVNLMIASANNPGSEEALSNQINMTLIQVLKHEWNTTWRNFIPELCASSQSDQNLCENNIKVLKLLSQEVFDFSKNQMTTIQVRELKQTLTTEFSQIYELCYKVMSAFIQNQSSVKASLMKNTLECLYTYLSWIPIGYIFLTELIEILITLIDQQSLRILALRCLTEVAALKLDVEDVSLVQQQQSKLFRMLEQSLLKVKSFFPCDYGFVGERLRTKQQHPTQLYAFDEFCQVLTLFFTTFLSTHLAWIEPLVNGQQPQIQVIQYCFQYVTSLTELPLDTNYKVCAEFWHEFTSRLLDAGNNNSEIGGGPLLLNLYGAPQQMTLKSSVYPKLLMDIRKIVVSHMSKPQEVLITVDESGMPCREEMTNTENNAMYELLRELMINLAKLNWNSTKDIIIQKLDKQVLNCLSLPNKTIRRVHEIEPQLYLFMG